MEQEHDEAAKKPRRGKEKRDNGASPRKKAPAHSKGRPKEKKKQGKGEGSFRLCPLGKKEGRKEVLMSSRKKRASRPPGSRREGERSKRAKENTQLRILGASPCLKFVKRALLF